MKISENYIAQTNTLPNSRLSWVGKERDVESNLGDYDTCVHGVRKYEPEAGRFLSIDPLWENYYACTPYHYCGNDPVNKVDVDGKEIIVKDPAQRAKILAMINKLASGTFAFDKDGKLYLASTSTSSTPKSQYYTDKLVAAIGKTQQIEVITDQKTYNAPCLTSAGNLVVCPPNVYSKTLDLTMDCNGGVSWGFVGTDQIVVLSGSIGLAIDDQNNLLAMTPEEILLHEFVAHVIPNIVGSDTGNGIDNDNKARIQLQKKLRQKDSKHEEQRKKQSN